jgi:hypothetical protein
MDGGMGRYLKARAGSQLSWGSSVFAGKVPYRKINISESMYVRNRI